MLSWNKRVFKKNPSTTAINQSQNTQSWKGDAMFQEPSGLCSATPSQERVTAAVLYSLGCLRIHSQSAWQGSGAQAMQLIQEELPGISTPPQTNLSWGAPIELNAFGFLGHSWVGKVRPLMSRWFWDEIKPLGVIPSSSCLGKFISNR